MNMLGSVVIITFEVFVKRLIFLREVVMSLLFNGCHKMAGSGAAGRGVDGGMT